MNIDMETNRNTKMLENIGSANELYKKLINEVSNSSSWEINDLNEDMAIVNQVIMSYWKPRYLLDHRNQYAYEFMNSNEILCTVTQDDIDWDSMQGVSEDCKFRARALDFHYPSFIYKFINGVAEVRWQLKPDGRYFMDEDGYGMSDDEEVDIYGFIDRKGKVVIKFRYIGDDYNLLKAMRVDAEKRNIQS